MNVLYIASIGELVTFADTLESRFPGGWGGGVLPYMGYTGMCRSTGYVFCFSDSGTGYKNHPFSLEQGIFYFRFDSGIVSNFP